MNPFSAAVRMMFSIMKRKHPGIQRMRLNLSGHSGKEPVLMQEEMNLTPLPIPSLHLTPIPSKRKTISEHLVVIMTGKAPMETLAKTPMATEALEEDIEEEAEAAIEEEEEEVATGAEVIEPTITMTEILTTSLPTAIATEAAMTITNSSRSHPSSHRIRPSTSNPPLLSQ